MRLGDGHAEVPAAIEEPDREQDVPLGRVVIARLRRGGDGGGRGGATAVLFQAPSANQDGGGREAVDRGGGLIQILLVVLGRR